MKRAMDVEIYGQTFTVTSEDDEQYVRNIAAVVDQRMRQMAGSTKGTVPLRVAIMAALSFADELETAKSDQQATVVVEEEAERISSRLLARLERAERAEHAGNGVDPVPRPQSARPAPPTPALEEPAPASLTS